MSRFFESIRVENGQIFLPDLHQRRMDSTFAYFGKSNPIDLHKIFGGLAAEDHHLYKWRVSYSLSGEFSAELLPYSRPEVKGFRLVAGDDISYHLKSENRAAIDFLKQKSGVEIIIIKSGKITDTSFSNLIFRKKTRWYTPSSFLLNGVQRQNLLRQNLISETEITAENLTEFTDFQIINAMNGFNENKIFPLEAIINLREDFSRDAPL